MNTESKRQSSFDQSSEENTKKFRGKSNLILSSTDADHDQSITRIEHLSNEIFYEIFDYLEGCQIYRVFIDLNRRFHQLVTSPSLRLRLQIPYRFNLIYWNTYQRLMTFNQHQIFSIDLSLKLDENVGIITAHSLDSSFVHLESLSIDSMQSDTLFSVLFTLSSLPRLCSLSIQLSYKLQELTKIYELVLHLPKLKFFKLSSFGHETDPVTLSLPMASSQSSSPIEHLVIEHSCTSANLSSILSYTPHLSRFILMHELDIDDHLPIISPIVLANLTYLCMDTGKISFNRFERSISQTFSKLQILRVLCDDRNYLDAHRWEYLISKHLPHLKTFDLRCFDFYINHENWPMVEYPGQVNDFFSSFWIERQWILQVEYESEIINYVINTYKKKWYDYPLNNPCDQSLKSMSFLLTCHGLDIEGPEGIRENIDVISKLAQVYHLITRKNVHLDALCSLLIHLPTLDSLQIPSLALSQTEILSDDEKAILQPILSPMRITKVYLETVYTIEEVFFLMEQCSQLAYLKVDSIKGIDEKIFVRLILMKIKIHLQYRLRLLSFKVPKTDTQMVKGLKKMIDEEKLLNDYSMKHIDHEIFLQWT